MLSDVLRNLLLCHLFCSLSSQTRRQGFPAPLSARADAAPSPRAATDLLFMPRLSSYTFNLFTTTLYELCCVSRVPVHIHLSHPIAPHWTTAFNLTSYATPQIKSVVTSFPTLFYVIVSFQWFLWSFGWRNWGRDMNGSKMHFFFPSGCCPVRFWFISSIFLAGHWRRIPPCAGLQLHFWGQVRLASSKDSLGWLSTSSPPRIYHSPLQEILPSKYIILPLTPAPHWQTQWLNNSANVCRHTKEVATATQYIKMLDTCCRIKNVKSAKSCQNSIACFFTKQRGIQQNTEDFAKGIDWLFAKLNTWQNKPRQLPSSLSSAHFGRDAKTS